MSRRAAPGTAALQQCPLCGAFLKFLALRCKRCSAKFDSGVTGCSFCFAPAVGGFGSALGTTVRYCDNPEHCRLAEIAVRAEGARP